MILLEDRLKEEICDYAQLLQDLRRVQALKLPQCYIGAGYIRNYIWDRLHGYSHRDSHTDIDVVYYDPEDVREERDVQIEMNLRRESGNPLWSVKNQARMHLRNHAEPYRSTSDALRYWPEMVTAVGARLDERDQLDICAPHGLEDLYGLIVRRSPLYEDRDAYLRRVESKDWQRKWPKLTIIRD